MLLTDKQADRYLSHGALRQAVRDAYRMDEEACLTERLGQARLEAAARDRIEARANWLSKCVRTGLSHLALTPSCMNMNCRPGKALF